MPQHDLTDSYKVYKDGGKPLGIASIELPEVEMMSDTLSGAGIMGEIDAPVTQPKAMTVKLTFSTKYSGWADLIAPGVHQLDCRINTLAVKKDSSYVHLGERVVLQVMNKKFALGKPEKAKKQENEVEFEVLYVKQVLDGKDTLEIDKLNDKFVVNGTDYRETARRNTGMES
ncbi:MULTISPECIES: phage major tail tube protein [unclassified Maridesulfovibrio]|uniref:phage major tail tube protein n=1 Tax=unclassified Maridesulfovibrio TaxID=2794999 RepID=UPI003B424778